MQQISAPPAAADRMKWGPALWYYGAVLAVGAGAGLLARRFAWPALSPLGQLWLFLGLVLVTFWPIFRLERPFGRADAGNRCKKITN